MMFMMFHAKPSHRPWLIAGFAAALAIGGALLFLAR